MPDRLCPRVLASLALLVAGNVWAQPVVPSRSEVRFPFQGRVATLRLSLAAAEFARYGELPHTGFFSFGYQMALARHDRVARRVAAAARRLADEQRWTRRALATFLLHVAQYVPYNRDSEHMRGDYVRYPAETFFMTGDCEDKSLLAYALLAEAGFEAVLVEVGDAAAGHVLVGVELPPVGGEASLEHGGRNYLLTEVSAARWDLGRIARDQSLAGLEVHRTNDDPRAERPRGLEGLPVELVELGRRDLRVVIDPEEPALVQLVAARSSRRLWGARYPSRQAAGEVLRFLASWQRSLSPFFVDVETLRAVRFPAQQLELRWE